MNEEKADEFMSAFSQEPIEAGDPTTVEEALNMPIGDVDEIVSDEEYLGSILEDLLEVYVRTTLLNVIEDVGFQTSSCVPEDEIDAAIEWVEPHEDQDALEGSLTVASPERIANVL